MDATLAFRPLTDWSLWIELRLDEGAVHAERVTAADLEDLRLESWWESRARRGAAGEARDGFEPRLAPVVLEGADGPADGCAGLLLEAADPAGERVRCAATSRALDPVARRALSAWLDRGGDARRAAREARLVLCAAASELTGFRVVSGGTSVPEGSEGGSAGRPHGTQSARRESEGGGDGVTAGPATTRPLPVLARPLAPLLAGAEPVGDDADLAPVLVTRAAREAAEAAARRGARRDPPVESGALLLGHLAACPDTGEAFAVVNEVLPAAEDGTAFSLDIPAGTWHAARARQRARPSLLVLGQAHGHNFAPQDVEGSRCAECARPATCACDTAFLSPEDRAWSRAVFRGQPWQVGQVFGLDAAGRPRDAFFGQRGARLVPRGYRLIDAFDPIATP